MIWNSTMDTSSFTQSSHLRELSSNLQILWTVSGASSKSQGQNDDRGLWQESKIIFLPLPLPDASNARLNLLTRLKVSASSLITFRCVIMPTLLLNSQMRSHQNFLFLPMKYYLSLLSQRAVSDVLLHNCSTSLEFRHFP